MEANEKQRQRVVYLRTKLCWSLRQIAEDAGLSRTRVHQLLNPTNPKRLARTYRCVRCGHDWKSKAVEPPRRCPPSDGGCGSYFWNQKDEHAA